MEQMFTSRWCGLSRFGSDEMTDVGKRILVPASTERNRNEDLTVPVVELEVVPLVHFGRSISVEEPEHLPEFVLREFVFKWHGGIQKRVLSRIGL